MEVLNDPRIIAPNVVMKRLAAFHSIAVVAVLMVNLSVKQMFTLEKNIDLTKATAIVQYVGLILMSMIVLMNLTTVVVLIQQMFMTYRLMTSGATGFEVAKVFYLNPNITTMRHVTVKAFFFSLPLFVASTSCMVWVSFAHGGSYRLAIPIVVLLGIASVVLWCVNLKHHTIFTERYALAKQHEMPLLSHVESVAHSQRSARLGSYLDV